MALSLNQTGALSTILKPGMKVVAFGYPDVIAPIDLIQQIMGEAFPRLSYREDSETICARHGMPSHPIPDAESFFKEMGCELIVYDIVAERGCERIWDLNRPFSFYRHGLGTFDLALDVGTVEHCFNISQAITNMAETLKEGGVILHENPYNWGNHGFYNLNPTFFHDFYTQNGFELKQCFLTRRNGDTIDIPLTKRFRTGVAEEFNIFAMAKRLKIQSIVMPTQSKYRVAPVAGAEPGVETANG